MINIPTLSEPYPIPQLPIIIDLNIKDVYIDFSNEQQIDEKIKKQLYNHFLKYRKAIDKIITKEENVNKNKPTYPEWHCTEIRDFVFKIIEVQIDDNQEKLFTKKWQWVFLKDTNIELKQIYWIQHHYNSTDEYFQNAFQLWNLIIDIAHNSVDTKTSDIKISNIKDSRIRNFTNYNDYCKVAQKYWWVEIIPNTIFPHLADLFPFFFKNKDWTIEVPDRIPQIKYLDIENNFIFSKDFIKNNIYSLNKIPKIYLNKIQCIDIKGIEKLLNKSKLNNSRIFKWWYPIELFLILEDYRKSINKFFSEIEDNEKIKKLQDK